MTIKNLSLLFAVIFSAALSAQEEVTEEIQEEIIEESFEESYEESYEEINDTWKSGRVTDEMTKDPDQNKEWRMGQNKYSAKPKNALEVGLHGGHFFIDGDVDRELPAGYGVGIHLRKALHYIFSIRLSGFYGVTKGLDPQPSYLNLVPEGQTGPGGVFEGYGPSTGERWFFNHKTTYYNAGIEGVLNVGNMLFHSDHNKWNWYIAMGIGVDHHSTYHDLQDADGDYYVDLIDRIDYTKEKFDTKEGRDEIKSNLKTEYDGTYETEGFQKKGIFRLGDSYNIHAMGTVATGVSRKISKRINLSFEHKVFLSDNDFLDGQKYRTNLDQSNNVDIAHYTHLVIGINFGNFNKRTEPLYWVNPMDATFNDIASLKQRPQLDLTDDDNDGVIDMLDQELDTPDGCAVDTRGITLDSDGDGIPDCKDQEPYSPPGLEIDESGVAAAAECCITEESIANTVDTKVQERVSEIETRIETIAGATGATGAAGANGTTTVVRTGCGDWFLPMIHFDNNKTSIKTEYYSQLHHVAQVMKKCPELCIVAHGHTDNKADNDYNNNLSYKRSEASIDYLVTNYGLDRSRLKLMYGGEENPLGGVDGSHYLNRRVEFRTCDGNDFDMAAPVGTGVQGESYDADYNNYNNGNKSSGY